MPTSLRGQSESMVGFRPKGIDDHAVLQRVGKADGQARLGKNRFQELPRFVVACRLRLTGRRGVEDVPPHCRIQRAHRCAPCSALVSAATQSNLSLAVCRAS